MDNLINNKEYIELFLRRLTTSSSSIYVNIADKEKLVRLKNNTEAFNILLNNEEDINEDIITEVANTVNKDAIYISNGYRKYGMTIVDTDIAITNPNSIKIEMKKLIYNYNHSWKDFDPYHREALFHLAFIRIHPFEDGNGRTARLIMGNNLMKQGLPPIIITKEYMDFYNEYIKNRNIKGLFNLFKILSDNETYIANDFNEKKHK